MSPHNLELEGMAPFATLATTITHEDIHKKAAGGYSPHDTPVLSLSTEARAKGYASICLPLTTGKWRERWQNMCIMPSTGAAGNEEVIAAEKAAEEWRKSPSFLLDEVTITRLGEISSPLHRSHSPVLLIGKLIDEAEIVVAITSDWLQLDATDDWIRHDSGIVSSFYSVPDSGHLRHDHVFGMSRPKKSRSMGAALLPG